MDRRSFLALAAAPMLSQSRPRSQSGRATTLAPPLPAAAPKPATVSWTQWGGPHRNFQTEASGLKDTWPASGPRVIWKRALGDGYSSTIVENGVLYTMYGKPKQEIALAANAESGQTLWERTTPMTFESDAPQMGNGPYSTPLLVGDRLFTAGVAGRLQCLDKRSGNVLWTQQLWEEHGGSRLMYGYASSPIAFRDTIVVPVGGRGRAVMAFQQADGKVAWSRNNFGNVYSSPILIDVDGLEQLVLLLDGALVGLNPHNGDPQWQVPFTADYSIAVATPVWGPGNLLFISAEYNGGAKVIELRRNGQQTSATELWSSNRLRLHHGNAMRIGETVYFSSGGKAARRSSARPTSAPARFSGRNAASKKPPSSGQMAS
jgi:outer membrane protein assembly factor BamB